VLRRAPPLRPASRARRLAPDLGSGGPRRIGL